MIGEIETFMEGGATLSADEPLWVCDNCGKVTFVKDQNFCHECGHAGFHHVAEEMAELARYERENQWRKVKGKRDKPKKDKREPSERDEEPPPLDVECVKVR